MERLDGLQPLPRRIFGRDIDRPGFLVVINPAMVAPFEAAVSAVT